MILLFLTFLMFVDCVLLVFLVLLQLPKKEAGAGMAFGGAATDALFGAGSGNVLTKITKYVAGIFFGLAILMAVVSGHKSESNATALAKSLTQAGATTMAPVAPPQTGPASTPDGGGLLHVPSAPAAASSNNTVQGPAPAPPVNTNK
jgi:preprotein translocase subunit SecG